VSGTADLPVSSAAPFRTHRTSIVGHVRLNSVQFSSHVQVGDNKAVCPQSDVLAVQREIPVFRADEGDFADFSIFSATPPWTPAREPVRVFVCHADPAIRVRSLDVKAVSVSSVLQIGANRCVRAVNRTKHIRMLLPRQEDAHAPWRKTERQEEVTGADAPPSVSG